MLVNKILLFPNYDKKKCKANKDKCSTGYSLMTFETNTGSRTVDTSFGVTADCKQQLQTMSRKDTGAVETKDDSLIVCTISIIPLVPSGCGM
jgi:hypothetical protein